MKEYGIKLEFIDVRKAFFHADARREIYVELPKEDAAEGPRGKLRKSLYGMQKAAPNWMLACIKFIEEAGFVRGAASPCALWHARRS